MTEPERERLTCPRCQEMNRPGMAKQMIAVVGRFAVCDVCDHTGAPETFMPWKRKD